MKMKKLPLVTLIGALSLSAPSYAEFEAVDSANLATTRDNTSTTATNIQTLTTTLSTMFGFGTGSVNSQTLQSAASWAVYGLFTSLLLPEAPNPNNNDSTDNQDLKLVPESADTSATNDFRNEVNDINVLSLFNTSAGSSTNLTYADPSPLNSGSNAILGIDVATNVTTSNTTNNPADYRGNLYMSIPGSQLIYNILAAKSPTMHIAAANAFDRSSVENKLTTVASTTSAYVNKLCGTSGGCRTPLVTAAERLSAISGGNDPTTYLGANATSSNTNFPNYYEFLEENLSPSVMPSLSVDSLLSPITYNGNDITDIGTRNNSVFYANKKGLMGYNQVSMADNFIRYLSGDVLPSRLSSQDEYNSYLAVANSAQCYTFRTDAGMKINAYRAMLRNYAAQNSVGISNLYYLMAKRRPNPSNSDTVSGTTPASQLEQEYKMATSRLFPLTQPTGNDADGNPLKKTKSEWMNSLETASSTQVQRQIALLLAEMNYQLMLNRMEQERIIVTLSAMQLGAIATQRAQLTIDSASQYVSTIPTPSIRLNDNQCNMAAYPGG